MTTMRIAPAALFLAACGPAPDGPAVSGNVADKALASAASPLPSPPSPSSPLFPVVTADCAPDAPQSPCPIVGHWRIAKVYVPGAADPLADDRAMIGATLTVTPNGDGPGALRWDGPDTGQFDIRDVCTGPFLGRRGAPAGDARTRRALAAALAAWAVPADPAAARMLGCDRGQWTVPDAAGGYGLVLPLGKRVAMQWYEGRFLLLERIG